MHDILVPKWSEKKRRFSLNTAEAASVGGKVKIYLPQPKALRAALTVCALLASSGVFLAQGRASTQVSPASRWATLEAIHQIENPHNSRQPGRFGELGAYQFRATTWAKHSRRPFSDALDRQAADLVAVRHHDWICERLVENGMAPSVYNVALAWNAGINAALRGSAPRRAHEYATRVGNIADDLNRRTLLANQ